MIRLTQVNKQFSERFSLTDINCQFSAAKTTVMIGQSGSGKSTILKLILGLQKVDSGEILFNDQTLTNQNLQMIRQQCGYVIQNGGLFPHLNAFQNIALAAQFHNWSLARIGSRITELANLCKMDPTLLKQYPHQLSGGQKQRVSIMRALMLDPQVVLMDEPLSALDPLIRYQLQTDLKQIFLSLRKTVILVTHDIHEAQFFTDQLIFVHEGKILQQGEFTSIIKKPADPFITEFISAQRHSSLDEATT
ncbi:MAG: ATP-binding cassette domain-containing protein [Calditrichaeota bacterium]|nr:ATP-binding cassette domain-containing protein [Calditrichota bacterium]